MYLEKVHSFPPPSLFRKTLLFLLCDFPSLCILCNGEFRKICYFTRLISHLRINQFVLTYDKFKVTNKKTPTLKSLFVPVEISSVREGIGMKTEILFISREFLYLVKP